MKCRALSCQIGLLLAAVTPVLVALPASAQTTPDAGSRKAKAKEEPKTLSTVVVTAERRAQNLQEVPAAVAAFGQAELERRQIANVGDLGSIAPNLQISNAPGDQTAAQVAIRGMAGYNPALFYDLPVGIYVDGVYLGKTQGAIFDLLNLQRIEVLRGPQGTLYGRNSMAGTINLVTTPPSGEFTGTAQIGTGRYGDSVGKVMVDLPAIGRLKATVGGRIERGDGWVQTTPGSSVPQLGNQHNQEAFVELLYDVTDNFSVDYRYDGTRVNQYSQFNQAIKSDLGAIFGIPGIIVNPDRQTTASVDAPSFEQMDIDGNTLTATWKLGGAGTLKYIGAHRELHWDDSLDLDGSPVAVAHTERLSRYRQTSNELQYLGSVGPWNWVAGLYDFSDNGYTENPQDFFFHTANFISNYGFGTHSRAAYGQIDYAVTRDLTLTVGLRRTVERKNISRFYAAGPVVIIPDGTTGRVTFSSTTPTVSLKYQLNPEHMVYVRFSKGYQSGGFNGEAQSVADVLTPFKPEYAKSFEAGIKSMFLGNTLRFNADAFYNRISNLQEPVFTATGAAGSNILNVGKAHTYGLEAQVQWQPVENFSLSLNYGNLHTKYDQFMELGVNVADNRAPVHSPRNTLALVLEGVLARTSKGVLRGNLDYRYTSSFYQYPYQLQMTNPAAQLAANTRIPGEGMVDGRLAFGGMDWGHGISGDVAVWVRNATNVAHVANSIDFGPGFANLIVANFQQPRTYGVTLTASW